MRRVGGWGTRGCGAWHLRYASTVPRSLAALIQGYSLPVATVPLASTPPQHNLATPATATAPSVGPTKKNIDHRWDCAYCSHNNGPHAVRCSLCAAPREGRMRGTWMCGTTSTCGHINSRNLSACEQCEAPFGGTREWTCQTCWTENARLSLVCRECRAPQIPTWQCDKCHTMCSVFTSSCDGCGKGSRFVPANDKLLRECRNCRSRVAPSYTFCNVCSASMACAPAAITLATPVAKTVSLPPAPEAKPVVVDDKFGTTLPKVLTGPKTGSPSSSRDAIEPTLTVTSPPTGTAQRVATSPPSQGTAPLWTCQRCKSPHRALKDSCPRCGHIRVKALHKARVADSWQCNACSIYNLFSRDSCDSCGAPGGPRIHHCPHCNAADQPYRKPCGQCGEVTAPTVTCEGCGRTTTFGSDGKCLHCMEPVGQKIGRHACSRCGTEGEFSVCVHCGKINSATKWICRCGMGNTPSRAQCKSCSLPKSASTLVVPSWWTCPSCSTANSATRKSCRTCKSPRSFGDHVVICQTCSQPTIWGTSQACCVCGADLIGPASHSEANSLAATDEKLLSVIADPPTLLKNTKKLIKKGGSKKASSKKLVCNLCGEVALGAKDKECHKCGMPL